MERRTSPGTSVFLAGTVRGAGSLATRAAVRAAAEAATDFSWLPRGDTVLIKPALNSGNPYPATTSPVAVAAMTELLRERGASRVIVGEMSGAEHIRVSPSGVSGSTRALMAASGMMEPVLAAGGEVYFFEEAGWNGFYEDCPATGSHWKRGLMMPNTLKEVDHILLMPRCARHLLTGATLGMKAVLGYWRTDTRLEYHRYASTLHEKTAEGNSVETLRRKQRLVLTAADRILVTYGPDNGHIGEPEAGLIIASESLVAHDVVSLAWLLENRRATTVSGRYAFADRSRALARLGNRILVSMVGDWRIALASEPLDKGTLESIWDDRVLNRAYEVFGGVPKVILEPANDLVSVDLMRRLGELVACPA